METNRMFLDKMITEIAKISSSIENLKQEIPNASIERNKQIQKELKKYQAKMHKIQKVLEKLLSEKRAISEHVSERAKRMIDEAVEYMEKKFGKNDWGFNVKYSKTDRTYKPFTNFWYGAPEYFTDFREDAGKFIFLNSLNTNYPEYLKASPFLVDFSEAPKTFQDEYKNWRNAFKVPVDPTTNEELAYQLSFLAKQFGEYCIPGDLTYWHWLSLNYSTLSHELRQLLQSKKLIFPGTLFRDDMGRMCVMSTKFKKREVDGVDEMVHSFIPFTPLFEAANLNEYQFVLFVLEE